MRGVDHSLLLCGEPDLTNRRVNVLQSAWCKAGLTHREFGVNDELLHLGMPSDNGLKDRRETLS